MKRYVADTHAFFWYRTAFPRLGAAAQSAFAEGVGGTAIIYLPAIVIAELFFLNEKMGRPLKFADELDRLCHASQFVLLPFLPEEVLDFDAHRSVPEMHDRMIIGAAQRLGAVCLTRDSEIIASGLVRTMW